MNQWHIVLSVLITSMISYMARIQCARSVAWYEPKVYYVLHASNPLIINVYQIVTALYTELLVIRTLPKQLTFHIALMLAIISNFSVPNFNFILFMSLYFQSLHFRQYFSMQYVPALKASTLDLRLKNPTPAMYFAKYLALHAKSSSFLIYQLVAKNSHKSRIGQNFIRGLSFEFIHLRASYLLPKCNSGTTVNVLITNLQLSRKCADVSRATMTEKNKVVSDV